MNRTETIFDNDFFKITRTGREYDFGIIIENKCDEQLTFDFGDYSANITISPNDWVGIGAGSIEEKVFENLKDFDTYYNEEQDEEEQQGYHIEIDTNFLSDIFDKYYVWED